jgi:hypothetical protein
MDKGLPSDDSAFTYAYFYHLMKICRGVLLYEKIKDPDDIRAIMIPFFGKFVFKYTKTLENKRKNVKNYGIVDINKVETETDTEGCVVLELDKSI